MSHRRQCVRGQGERQPDGRPSAAERAMALYLIAFNDERTAARQQPGGAHYPRAPRPRADGGRTFTTLSSPARWWSPAEPWNSTTPSQPASAGYRTSGSGTAPDSIGPDRRVGQNGGYRTSLLSRPSQRVTVIAVTGQSVIGQVAVTSDQDSARPGRGRLPDQRRIMSRAQKGSQAGSQRPQIPGHAGLLSATIGAAQRHVRPHPATSGDYSNAPEKTSQELKCQAASLFSRWDQAVVSS